MQISQVAAKSVVSVAGSNQPVQRILLPAPAQVPIRPAANPVTVPSSALATLRPSLPPSSASIAQLPPGTTILSGGNVPGVQGYALLPASYVAQVRWFRHFKLSIIHPGACKYWLWAGGCYIQVSQRFSCLWISADIWSFPLAQFEYFFSPNHFSFFLNVLQPFSRKYHIQKCHTEIHLRDVLTVTALLK